MGSMCNEVLSQLWAHSPEPHTQIPMEFPYLVRYDRGFFVKKATDHQIRISIMCTSLSIPVFHSPFFLASCFKRTSYPFRRLSFHLAITPLGFCLLSVLFFHHHQYHHSLPLHRFKESRGPEKSSNWNQHWMTASLSSLLSKAGVTSLIHGYLTTPTVVFLLFLKASTDVQYPIKNLYLIQ